MLPRFEKASVRWIDERFGAHYRRTEGAGRIEVRDDQLRLGDQLVFPMPFVTSGCFKEAESARLVVLLCWRIFTRVEVTVESREEAEALLAALGFLDLTRPMSFEILTPAARPNLKALAISLGTWAIMAAVGMGLVFGARALGYQLPRWLLMLAMSPLVIALMALMWRAYTTPLLVGPAGLTLGRGEEQKQIPWSSIREVKLESDGVLLVLATGETQHLKTQAAPNLPDPVKDVLYGAIVAARARHCPAVTA